MRDGKNLYEQLLYTLIDHIKNNTYKVGEAIPSERKLCSAYSISRSTVRKAIESDPENPELYAGLGRVYDKLGQIDNSIEAFKTANNLLPDDFNTNFNLGFMILKKADAMADEFAKMPFTSKEASDAELEKVLSIFRESLPVLEKAHAAKPEDAVAVELLKNVYFRLRDESPEMLANYNKYKDLFDTMGD